MVEPGDRPAVARLFRDARDVAEGAACGPYGFVVREAARLGVALELRSVKTHLFLQLGVQVVAPEPVAQSGEQLSHGYPCVDKGIDSLCPQKVGRLVRPSGRSGR